MESFASYVEYHEFLDVLLQPFLSFSFGSAQEPESHFKERPRRSFQRRFTDGESNQGEGKTHELGVTQLAFSVECEEQTWKATANTSSVNTRIRKVRRNTSKDSVETSQAWKQENAQNTEAWEQDNQGTSSSCQCQETDTNRGHKRDKDGIPRHEDHILSISVKGLPIPTTKVGYQNRIRDVWD